MSVFLVAAALVWTGMLWDVAMVSFGFSKSYPLTVALLFVMGFGGWLHTVFLVTLFQTIPTEELRGRVMSVFGLIGSGVPSWIFVGRRVGGDIRIRGVKQDFALDLDLVALGLEKPLHRKIRLIISTALLHRLFVSRVRIFAQ